MGSLPDNSKGKTAAAVGMGVVLAFLALPSRSPRTPTALLASGLFVLTCAALFLWSLQRKMFATTLIISLYALAYSYRQVEAMSVGIGFSETFVRPENAIKACLLLLVFLLNMFLSARLVSRTLGASKGLSARLGAATGPSWNLSIGLSLAILLAAAAFVAFEVGAWTFYGGNRDPERQGGFRMESEYIPLLLGSILIVIRALSRGTAKQKLTLSTTIWLGVAVVTLLGLLFVIQSRRLLLAAGFAVIVSVLYEDDLVRQILRSPTRIVALGMFVMGLGALGVYGSRAWRTSVGDVEDASVGDRVQMTAQRAEVTSEFEDEGQRITYLWMDGLAVEHAEVLEGHMSLSDAALGTLATATPAILFPGKGEVDAPRCENAFQLIGIWDVDLPCTPTAEAYLGMGFLGVVMIGLLWGAFIGVADYLWTLEGLLPPLVSAQLLVPFFEIEASAFPIFDALRLALIGGIMVATLAAALHLVFRSPTVRVRA